MQQLVCALLLVLLPTVLCGCSTVGIAETMPTGTNIQPIGISIYQGWLDMINNATQTLDICCMYFTLTQGPMYNDTHAFYGQNIFTAVAAALQRGVVVRVITTDPPFDNDTDVQSWKKLGASVVGINWSKMVGSGILHSKFMVADQATVYVGSANFDWRALVHTKEIGTFVEDCPLVAADLGKIFDLYWLVGPNNKLPPSYPPNLDTEYNLQNPAPMPCGSNSAKFYLAASPEETNTPNRTNDIDAFVSALSLAQTNISASVMDYSAAFLYTSTHSFWPTLDNAFRSAAARGVKLRLLFSHWDHTNMHTWQYLLSLSVLENVEVRVFVIPPNPDGPDIPYTRVSHSKYLVTDNLAYITTSNWTPDYFVSTAGASVTFACPSFIAQVQELFNRDWESQYSSPIKGPQ